MVDEPEYFMALTLEKTVPIFIGLMTTDFVEDNSVVKLLPEGRSISIFYFPQAFFSGKLRINPGDLPGKYIIHQIEI